jgi:hypothetical protein
VSVHQLLWYFLTLGFYSNFFSYEDHKTEEDPDDPEPADPSGIFLWLVVEPKYRSSNKKLHVRT